MNDSAENQIVEIYAVVEGQTEQIFFEKILTPYLAPRLKFVRAKLLGSQRGQGGDVKFERVFTDVELFLKSRPNVFVTTMIDYYGVNTHWPGLSKAEKCDGYREKAETFCQETKSAILEKLKSRLGNVYRPNDRFIPYVSMHEFEALLFSDVEILAENLNVRLSDIQKIFTCYNSPEEIDNSPETAPAKRLEKLNAFRHYRKTTMGIQIAERIGVDKMRARCQIFNDWLSLLENLVPIE